MTINRTILCSIPFLIVKISPLLYIKKACVPQLTNLYRHTQVYVLYIVNSKIIIVFYFVCSYYNIMKSFMLSHCHPLVKGYESVGKKQSVLIPKNIEIWKSILYVYNHVDIICIQGSSRNSSRAHQKISENLSQPKEKVKGVATARLGLEEILVYLVVRLKVSSIRAAGVK